MRGIFSFFDPHFFLQYEKNNCKKGVSSQKHQKTRTKFFGSETIISTNIVMNPYRLLKYSRPTDGHRRL